MTTRPRLLRTLSDIGLSDNEAEVYLGALSSGPSTVQQLARASSVKRTTVYYVVEMLKKKGLLNVEVKGLKNLYVAESPEKLESIMEERKQLAQSVLPELLALYNLKGSDSFIKYYEGAEAIKSVYEGLLRDARPGDDYLVISDFERWYKLAPEYYQSFLERRAAMDLKIRVLTTDTRWAQDHLKTQSRYNWKIKLFPPGTQLTTNVVIIPKKVVVHQLIPPIIALVLENVSIVQYHRELFDIIWNR
jgi:HTH-type transcriptional regulator, sugar sensing transcriptional regulator